MTRVLEEETEPALFPLPPREGSLRVSPLGGVGEFGMNVCALEYGEDILVIDCGLMFPDHEMLGIDLVVPDVTFLAQRADRIRGIVLTHGHEDHIGGLPYVLPRIKAPIYGSPLTIGLARHKLGEFDLDFDPELHAAGPRERVQLGAFEVEFIPVTHSIPEAYALAIRTPAGLIVHTGDYRIDNSPVAGENFDTYSLSRCGEEGVLLLMADSTNVERPGTAGSEIHVRETFERIFAETQGQVILAMFSSAIYRMQIALDAAAKTGRTVFASGYSIERNIDIARDLGCLRCAPGAILTDREIQSVPPEQRLILTAGSQGEPLSALSRVALGTHKRISVDEGDAIIISSRIIPGNERAVYRMINHLFRQGARVYYERNADVHTSGHAYRDEMRTMLGLTKPRFFAPVHGELYQLIAHRDLAIETGMDSKRMFILEDGQSLELADGEAHLGPRVAAGPVLVDGKTVGEIGEVVLRDRQHLSQDGMITVVLVVDRSNGEILAGPDIVSRGFVYMDESEDLIQRCKDVVLKAYNACDVMSREESEVLQTELRRALRKFLKKETERYPVILPLVMEI